MVESIKFLDDFNENNAIITNRNVLKEKTNILPWFPNNPKDLFESIKNGSIMPRIITMVELEDKQFGSIYVLNTHLDYQLKSVQTRQLKRLYDIIKILNEANYPIVLTGDFNMKLGINPQFDDFVNGLNNLGLKRVPVNNKTNAEKFENKTAIDHIFIPKTWIIENAGLINDNSIASVTDHKGIFADIRVR